MAKLSDRDVVRRAGSLVADPGNPLEKPLIP
jgi:hypothetical protein